MNDTDRSEGLDDQTINRTNFNGPCREFLALLRPILLNPVVLGAGILIATLVVYHSVGQAGFLWDDNTLVYQSKLVQDNWGLFKFWFSTEPVDYFPLTNTTFWIEWRLWGKNPLGYHVTNVLLHALGAVLIWRVMLRLLPPNAKSGAWWVGMIFAVHPVSVASAAWISERKNTLSLALVAAAALLFLNFDQTKSQRVYRWSIAVFVLALLAKTSVVMLPVLLLLWVWWRKDRMRLADLRPLLPFFIASFVLGLVTVYFQYTKAITESHHDLVRPEGLASRLAAAGWVVWFYVGKTLWPFGLTMVYPRWDVDPKQVNHWLPTICLAGAVLGAWQIGGRTGRTMLFGLGGFVVLLFPVLGFFNMSFFRYAFVADHLLYIPMLAILALTAGSIAWWAARGGMAGRVLGVISGSVTVIVLGVMSFNRAAIFESPDSLWQDNLARFPDSWAVHFLNGADLRESGRLAEAIPHYERAIEIKPDYTEAHHNLAGCYYDAGRIEESLEHYETATSQRPTLSMAYHGQGRALAKLRRIDESIERYQKSLEINPDQLRSLVNLGLMLSHQGRHVEANHRLKRAQELESDNVEVQYFCGVAFYNQGQLDYAEAKLRAALQLNPEHTEALKILRMVLDRKKRSAS